MPIAVNPETGETLVLAGNEWVKPSQIAKNEAGETAYLVKNQWVLPGQDYVPEKGVIETITDPITKAIPQRASELGASLVESVQRGTEFLGKKMEAALTPEEREGLAKAKEKVPGLSKVEPEQIFRGMEQTASNLRDYSKSIGYTPTDTLGDLGDNPLKVFRFIYERVIQSTPDMAAAVLNAPAYVYSRTNEILNDRLANDQKELKDATVEDVTKALAGAVVEANLEKFATGRLFKPGTGKSVAGRVSKEAGVQAGTEMLEEGAAYIAGTQGTKKGVDPQELAEVMAEAGIVGLGLGSTVQGAKEVINRKGSKEEPQPVEGSETAPPVAKAPVVPTATETQDTALTLAELEAQQAVNQGFQKQLTDQDLEDKISEAKDLIIQNRNRATPASIAQMTDIANNLDYDKVSFSKSFNDGAPVVSDALPITPEYLGRKSIITTSDGRKIPVQYAVVPADTVMASNNADGSTNTEFFNPDSQYAKAIAGNARTAGIQAAYNQNTADKYRSAMLEDTDHGIDPKVIEATPNPMLVRIMPKDQITNDIGDISNTATNLNLSTIEQAKNDANRIDLQWLQYDENGDLTLTGIRGFVNAMPTTERANLIDENGIPTRQALDRIEAAVFQKAYNNDNLTALAHQAQDPEARNIIKGLVEAAPQMSRLEGSGEYDFRPQLAQAAELAVNARRAGNKLSDVVAQQDMTADPLTYDFLQMFADNPRSAKAIGENLKRAANSAYTQTQEGAVDMFGERPVRSPKELLATAFTPAAQNIEQLPLTMTQRSDTKNDLLRAEKVFNLNAPKEYRPLTEKSAKEALNRGEISQSVYNLIQAVEKRFPRALRGLSLSIGQYEGNEALAAQGLQRAGEFAPLERLIKLYRNTEGTYNPDTIRHEITHSLEQLMPKQAKEQLVSAWQKAVNEAEKAQISAEGKQFFVDLRRFFQNPTVEGMNNLFEQMPTTEYYQYITPSEYWAVNAEPLMQKQLGGAWERFKYAIRSLLESLKNMLGMDNRHIFYRVFDQAVNGDKLTTEIVNNYITNLLPATNTKRNFRGENAPLAHWNMPDNTKMDNFLYKIQDKFIDTKRAIQAIKNQTGEIAERWDAYLKEELYHGRTAKRIQNFLRNELRPLLQEMQKKNVEISELNEFLHMRHAPERNMRIAKINPQFPDGGSGITTEEANKYMSALPPAKKAALESIAKKVDDIIQETQKVLVASGQEEQSTIDIWNKAYKHYVPLMREDLDFSNTSAGTGQGFSVRGPASRRAVGSEKAVANIFASIAEQRERAIIRGEKARVGTSIFGLALLNPNPGFWLPVNPDAIKDPEGVANELKQLGIDPSAVDNFMQEPLKARIDSKTGLVTYEINPVFRNSDYVLPVRYNGKDRFLFFNPNDPRAMRMVSALKNLDAAQLEEALGYVSKGTRWIASVNTQYNPVFGGYNFLRDVGGAQFNLTTTPIAGEQKKVTAYTMPALKGIYKVLRAQRDNKPVTDAWGKVWEDFQEQGGQTGYRDQFSKTRKEQNILEQEMANLNRGNISKGVKALFNWLSDYNDALENAVRLAAYKVALEKGLSKDRAASLAKNLTVNFNRKGAWGQTIGAFYAFFGASVQGTARLMETLKGPKGRLIIGGGLLLGAMQAIALAMMGYDDNEPPEFIKERNLVIPFPDGRYFAIPMPLGLHVIPNTGRLLTEAWLGGGKNAGKKMTDLLGVYLSSFNPIGHAGFSFQTFTPTLADPYVAIRENVDTFGRPIARQDRGTNPTPGYTRSRDTASTLSKELSYFLNLASGGTKYQKGAVSPTPDQLDYLFGQATGGVGRELLKTEQAVTSLITGEELPSYKVPLVGRFYGDINSQASQANQFYDNITKMANHENEIKGRMKNRENTTEYLRENPEARLWRMANRVENEISDLNRQKKELIARNAPKEQVQRIEQMRTRKMEQFNRMVREAEER